MMIEARRAYRGVSGALLALTLVLLATVPVAQADTIYPDNVITGSAFTTGLANPGGSSWATDADSNHCTLLLGLIPDNEPATCNVDTTHDAGIGTPPGSMRQSYEPVATGLSPLLFDATTTATSSPFTIGPITGGASGKTTFQFDRRADVQAILDGDSSARYTFTLIDVTGGGNVRSQLFQEDLNDNDNDFRGQLNDLMPNVTPGHTYRIEISTTFRTAFISVALQKTIVNFDNIRLRVVDGTATFGEPGAITDPADDITGTSATLNGRTNARGLDSTYVFHYGTQATGPLTNTIGPFSAGTGTTFQARSRPITGLTACTRYYFEIEATNSQGTTNGGRLALDTACKPDAVTLAVMTSPDAATFSSSINPRSLDTTYYYEYGTVASGAFGSRIPLATDPQLTIPAGTRAVAPNSYPVGGLTKQTAYQVRVVAFNDAGSTTGNVVQFTTPGTGDTGAPGTNGTNGTNGTDGAPGAQGPAGTTGSSGPAGPAGPKGATGSAGTAGKVLNINTGDPRALIRIYGQSISVPRKGRNVGRVRVRIFCRTIAELTCSGAMKVRSVNPIAPQSFGFPAKAKRRVTFATDAVQLDVGKVGYAILQFNAQRRSVLRREKSVSSTVIVTVIDAANNRQNVRAVLPVRLTG
ncbi:MAG: hypothetical protein QOJ89_2800 [bacterium]